MNISPDLAAKVLDADLRNIVKKVSDGGILSVSERQLLQTAAVPDSQGKARRALVLALKYSSGGRLTSVELAEVREQHPGFAPEAVAEEVAAADMGNPISGAPGLTLTPQPSPANGDAEVTRTQLDDWSKLYDTEHRQIRRWIARGKERSEPCPLDDAEKMPSWIDRHLDKKRATLVEKVAAVAAAARERRAAQVPSPAPAATPDPAAPNPASTAGGAAASAKVDAVNLVAPLDLATVGGVEGEAVGFFRTIFAAVKIQLDTAYKTGNDNEIRKLHTRLTSVAESLRKHEKEAEARAIRMEAYLDKAEVLNEVSQALGMLALLRELRVSRVRAELADIPGEILDRLTAVINTVGEGEEDVLRNLGVLKSPEDVSVKMAA